MSKQEQPNFEDPNKQPERQETEQEKRARLISRYIEEQVVGANESLNAEEEKELEEYYEEMSDREKADILYSKLMAYTFDKQAESARARAAEKMDEEFEPMAPDSYMISEIKVLFSDPAVQELFSERYGEARVDAKKLRVSELGKMWHELSEEMREKEEVYKKLEQDMHLQRIEGRGRVSAAKSRMAMLADNLSALEKRKHAIESLDGFSRTEENTDVAAQLQYEQLAKYHEQLDQDGFVWLPSRKDIHRQTVSAVLNHRWPSLIGEAGTGKSEQADAAAKELTGYSPTEIECEATTGERQLIADKEIDPETGGSYDRYGPLMQAFTGYEDSRQEEPAFDTGRIARFDESGRMGPQAYSIVKKARQRQPGDDFYGHPVLPGAGAIWTSNPPGPRYPDRNPPDPAMRRELAEIYVNYPEMSEDNPELYEFALSALFDENDHIAAPEEELAPAYNKKTIPEEQREVLEDGSIVVAEEELVSDMSDPKHGALWRFCAAVKALQDSFVYGNSQEEGYPESLLRYTDNEDGSIGIINHDGGEPLTLSTSTVTLGELASWLQGFNERREKQDEDFRVDTLTEWLNFKINTYLNQVDKADKEKVRAIFKHFGFLQDRAGEAGEAKPLTPKEVGYLSPRVPRSVEVERSQKTDDTDYARAEEQGELREYEEVEVLLEDGDRIKIIEDL